MIARDHNTKGELLRFLAVGTASVAIDFLTYNALLAAGLQTGPAKACGFVAGTIFAYFANRIITFRAAGGYATVARFLAAYAIGFVVNVSVNSALVFFLGTEWQAIAMAFVVATALSTASNFLSMKFFVFEQRTDRELSK